MKLNVVVIAIIAFLALSFSCRSQQPVMRTLEDISKIKKQASTYEGQPLSKLLKDIGVPIVFVSPKEGPGIEGYPGYFYFRFYIPSSPDSLRAVGKKPRSIQVYIKEKFEWDFKSRPQDEKYVWTPEDNKRYGNLTVTGVRVMGAE